MGNRIAIRTYLSFGRMVPTCLSWGKLSALKVLFMTLEADQQHLFCLLSSLWKPFVNTCICKANQNLSQKNQSLTDVKVLVVTCVKWVRQLGFLSVETCSLKKISRLKYFPQLDTLVQKQVWMTCRKKAFPKTVPPEKLQYRWRQNTSYRCWINLTGVVLYFRLRLFTFWRISANKETASYSSAHVSLRTVGVYVCLINIFPHLRNRIKLWSLWYKEIYHCLSDGTHCKTWTLKNCHLLSRGSSHNRRRHKQGVQGVANLQKAAHRETAAEAPRAPRPFLDILHWVVTTQAKENFKICRTRLYWSAVQMSLVRNKDRAHWGVLHILTQLCRNLWSETPPLLTQVIYHSSFTRINIFTFLLALSWNVSSSGESQRGHEYHWACNLTWRWKNKLRTDFSNFETLLFVEVPWYPDWFYAVSEKVIFWKKKYAWEIRTFLYKEVLFNCLPMFSHTDQKFKLTFLTLGGMHSTCSLCSCKHVKNQTLGSMLFVKAIWTEN